MLADLEKISALINHVNRGLKSDEVISIIDILIEHIDQVRFISGPSEYTTNLLLIPPLDHPKDIYIQFSRRLDKYRYVACKKCPRISSCYNERYHDTINKLITIASNTIGSTVATVANNVEAIMWYLENAFKLSKEYTLNVCLATNEAYALKVIEVVRKPIFNCLGEYIGEVAKGDIREQYQQELDAALDARDFEKAGKVGRLLQEWL